MTDLTTLYRIFLQSTGVTTDSRRCFAGSLFIALRGETFDGNAFAAQALKDGCAHAVIDNPAYLPEGDPRYLLVDDTLKALQALARHHRRTLGTPIIGITGTNGKTTTKELTAAVLSQKYNLHYTQGNLNNHIGVPLTLLNLRPEHQLAVIEMGASHPGDIRELVNIAEPDYGLITNVGRAHLEGFGSFEGVIRTKGELFDFLREKGGATVFVHDDNPYLKEMAHDLQQVRYGTQTGLFVSGRMTDNSPYLALQWEAEGETEYHAVQTHLIGEYNLPNVLAAIAVGHFFHVTPAQIDQALEAYIPRNNRSQLKETASNILIIDTYNANPTSMGASLNNFKNMKAEHKMCILGDMKELGEYGKAEHQKVVDTLQECGVETVWLVGNMFKETKHPDNFRTFDNVDEVKDAIKAQSPKDMTILIKGSNSTKLYELPELL